MNSTHNDDEYCPQPSDTDYGNGPAFVINTDGTTQNPIRSTSDQCVVTCGGPEDDDKLYPHPYDCDRFCLCYNGIPYNKACPDKLQFSREANRCEYPDPDGCQPLCPPTVESCVQGFKMCKRWCNNRGWYQHKKTKRIVKLSGNMSGILPKDLRRMGCCMATTVRDLSKTIKKSLIQDFSQQRLLFHPLYYSVRLSKCRVGERRYAIVTVFSRCHTLWRCCLDGHLIWSWGSYLNQSVAWCYHHTQSPKRKRMGMVEE